MAAHGVPSTWSHATSTSICSSICYHCTRSRRSRRKVALDVVKDRNSPKHLSSSTGGRALAANGNVGETYREKRWDETFSEVQLASILKCLNKREKCSLLLARVYCCWSGEIGYVVNFEWNIFSITIQLDISTHSMNMNEWKNQSKSLKREKKAATQQQ